jgi:hypothetical protein
MKLCSGKCGLEKDNTCFHKNKASKNGLRGECKSCISAKKKQHYEKPEVKEQKKNYHIENREEILDKKKTYREKPETQVKTKDYDQNPKNKEKRNKQRRERRNNDPSYKLRTSLSTSIFQALKRNCGSKKSGSIINHLPYTIEKLKIHLESLFEPWMNWENHGKYNKKTWNENDKTTWTWHLDHIVAHCNFKYADMICEDFKKCWALSNLRPLSAKENVIKGNR